MAKIKDFGKSIPRKADANRTWAWEVIIDDWDDNDECIRYDKVVARFFDPWKAVYYGVKHYNGMCMVQAVLLKTNELEKE